MLWFLPFRRNFWNCIIFYFFLYRSSRRISRSTPVCCTAYEGAIRAAVTWWMVLPSMPSRGHVQHLTQVLTRLETVFLAYKNTISFSFCYSFYTWLSLCTPHLFVFHWYSSYQLSSFHIISVTFLISSYLLPLIPNFFYILLLPWLISLHDLLALYVSIFSSHLTIISSLDFLFLFSHLLQYVYALIFQLLIIFSHSFSSFLFLTSLALRDPHNG